MIVMVAESPWNPIFTIKQKLRTCDSDSAFVTHDLDSSFRMRDSDLDSSPEDSNSSLLKITQNKIKTFLRKYLISKLEKQ